MHDRILEIGAIDTEGCTFQRLINNGPEHALDPFITRLTGITPQEVLEVGVTHRDALLDFAAFIGHGTRDEPLILAAHNATFDTSFLARALTREGIQQPNSTIILDSMLAFQLTHPHARRSRLADTIATLFPASAFNHTHRALDDARAVMRACLAMSHGDTLHLATRLNTALWTDTAA